MSDQREELNRQAGDAPGAEQARNSQPADLESMTKEELLAYAEQTGAKVKPAMNKSEIIQIITETQGAGVSSGDAAASTPAPEKGNAKTGKAPVGTIRVQDGVEQVKVGPDQWVPTIREEIASDEPVVLFSMERAGKTVFGKTGKPIVFDENGKATVCAIDGLYLKDLPNYSLVEGNE
jgi:hypothetical protein